MQKSTKDAGSWRITLRDHASVHAFDNVPSPLSTSVSKADYPTLKCPKCSADMIGGKLAVHGTFWGFIFVGWSYQPCWWQPEGDPGKEEKLIEANGARDAFRCASCRMIIIPEE